jgi:hypothetical protein
MVYKKVRLIEKSDLSLDQKCELLLIYAGKKPAGIIYDKPKNYESIMLNSFSDCIRRKDNSENIIIKLLNSIGLEYKLGDVFEQVYFAGSNKYYSEKSIPAVEILPLYIGRDDYCVEKIFNAKKTNNNYNLGIMFGYPDTAIQAFLGNRTRFNSKYFESIQSLMFTQFVFSKDFFKEEFNEVSKIWENTIKRLSPRLYNEIGDYYKNSFLI